MKKKKKQKTQKGRGGRGKLAAVHIPKDLANKHSLERRQKCRLIRKEDTVFKTTIIPKSWLFLQTSANLSSLISGSWCA